VAKVEQQAAQRDDVDEIELALLLEGIYRRYGFDFREYAPASLRRRVARRVQAEGLTTVTEGFGDRGYASDGRLVPRSHPQALLTDADAVAQRVVHMVTEGTVVSVDGGLVAVPVRSVPM
jgi:lactam utilization protein B